MLHSHEPPKGSMLWDTPNEMLYVGVFMFMKHLEGFVSIDMIMTARSILIAMNGFLIYLSRLL